jgi:hypothetical protein
MNQEIVVIVRIILTSITMTRQQINVNTLITPDVEAVLTDSMMNKAVKISARFQETVCYI